MTRALTEEEASRLAWLSLLPSTRAGLYEITETQLSKSVVDANETIRTSFRETGFHDFEAQPPGEDAKRLLPIWLLTASGLKPTKISLYRPHTKGGVFCRTWIRGLVAAVPNAYPGDVMALVQDGATCVAFNLTLFELTEDRRQDLLALF